MKKGALPEAAFRPTYFYLSEASDLFNDPLHAQFPLIYTDNEWTSMWLLNWLPGVLSLPLSLLVVYSEVGRIKRVKQKDRNVTEYYLFIAAGLCVLHVIVDSIPSMILGSDMRCGANRDIFFHSVYPEGSSMQQVAAIKVNIMQALMITVAFMLWKVRQQLKASKKMSKYSPSRTIRFGYVFCAILVPIISLLLCRALRADFRYEQNTAFRSQNGGQIVYDSLTVPNDVRYMYTGGPKFNSTIKEFVLVQGPSLIAGIALPLLSLNLIGTVIAMGGKVSAVSADSKSGGGNPALRKLAMSMIYFAVVSLICIGVQVEAVFTFLPQAVVFGSKMAMFLTCAQSGVPTQFWENGQIVKGGNQHVFLESDLETTLQKCGDYVAMAPPAAIIQRLLLSQSLPILLFGGLFALPALRQLKQNVKSKMRSATSAASSASG